MSGYMFRVRAKNAYGVSEPGEVTDPAVTKEKKTDSDLPFNPRQVKVRRDIVERFYDVNEVVGRGRFATVQRCLEKLSGRLLAARTVRLDTAEQREKLLREVEMMQQLHHGKLLQLYDAFELDSKITLVQEFLEGGPLMERLLEPDFTQTEREAAIFIHQVCEGLQYLHGQQVAHLDLRPESVMCADRTGCNIKLRNFGSARRLHPRENIRVKFEAPEFCAPEVVNFGVIWFAADMWSLGVMTYLLLCGVSPFAGKSDLATLRNIIRGNIDMTREGVSSSSQEARDFLKGLLAQSKEARYTIEQCLQHSWLQRDRRVPGNYVVPKQNIKDFMARRKWQEHFRGLVSVWTKDVTTERASYPNGPAAGKHRTTLEIPRPPLVKSRTIEGTAPTEPATPPQRAVVQTREAAKIEVPKIVSTPTSKRAELLPSHAGRPGQLSKSRSFDVSSSSLPQIQVSNTLSGSQQVPQGQISGGLLKQASADDAFMPSSQDVVTRTMTLPRRERPHSMVIEPAYPPPPQKQRPLSDSGSWLPSTIVPPVSPRGGNVSPAKVTVMSGPLRPIQKSASFEVMGVGRGQTPSPTPAKITVIASPGPKTSPMGQFFSRSRDESPGSTQPAPPKIDQKVPRDVQKPQTDRQLKTPSPKRPRTPSPARVVVTSSPTPTGSPTSAEREGRPPSAKVQKSAEPTPESKQQRVDKQQDQKADAKQQKEPTRLMKQKAVSSRLQKPTFEDPTVAEPAQPKPDKPKAPPPPPVSTETPRSKPPPPTIIQTPPSPGSPSMASPFTFKKAAVFKDKPSSDRAKPSRITKATEADVYKDMPPLEQTKPPVTMETKPEKTPATMETKPARPPVTMETKPSKPPVTMETKPTKPPVTTETKTAKPPVTMETKTVPKDTKKKVVPSVPKLVPAAPVSKPTLGQTKPSVQPKTPKVPQTAKTEVSKLNFSKVPKIPDERKGEEKKISRTDVPKMKVSFSVEEKGPTEKPLPGRLGVPKLVKAKSLDDRSTVEARMSRPQLLKKSSSFDAQDDQSPLEILLQMRKGLKPVRKQVTRAPLVHSKSVPDELSQITQKIRGVTTKSSAEKLTPAKPAPAPTLRKSASLDLPRITVIEKPSLQSITEKPETPPSTPPKPKVHVVADRVKVSPSKEAESKAPEKFKPLFVRKAEPPTQLRIPPHVKKQEEKLELREAPSVLQRANLAIFQQAKPIKFKKTPSMEEAERVEPTKERRRVPFVELRKVPSVEKRQEELEKKTKVEKKVSAGAEKVAEKKLPTEVGKEPEATVPKLEKAVEKKVDVKKVPEVARRKEGVEEVKKAPKTEVSAPEEVKKAPETPKTEISAPEDARRSPEALWREAGSTRPISAVPAEVRRSTDLVSVVITASAQPQEVQPAAPQATETVVESPQAKPAPITPAAPVAMATEKPVAKKAKEPVPTPVSPKKEVPTPYQLLLEEVQEAEKVSPKTSPVAKTSPIAKMIPERPPTPPPSPKKSPVAKTAPGALQPPVVQPSPPSTQVVAPAQKEPEPESALRKEPPEPAPKPKPPAFSRVAVMEVAKRTGEVTIMAEEVKKPVAKIEPVPQEGEVRGRLIQENVATIPEGKRPLARMTSLKRRGSTGSDMSGVSSPADSESEEYYSGTFSESDTESSSYFTAGEDEENTAPVFLKRMLRQTVQEGSTTRFEVVVIGQPKPAVMWLRNNFPIKESEDFQFLQEGNIYCLVLREAYPEDAGLYTCRAINSVDVVSCSAELRVEEGLYTCRAINSVDVVSCSAELRVKEELTDEEGEPMVHPEFQQKIKPLEVAEDDPARMDCKVTGVPEPEVTWYKDGVEITQDPEYQFLFEDEESMYKDGVEITQDPEYQFLFEDEESMCLIVPVASKKHEGLYSCLAGNKLGQVACYARLTVKEKSRRPAHPGPPSFLTTLADVFAVEGSQACFTCTVVGNPDPDIEWLLDSRLLKPTQDFSMSFENDMAKLILKTAYPEDQDFSMSFENDMAKLILKTAYPEDQDFSMSFENDMAKLILKTAYPEDQDFNMSFENDMAKLILKTAYPEDQVGQQILLTCFTCTVVGNPNPDIEWLLDSRVLKPTQDFNMSFESEMAKLILKTAYPEDQNDMAKLILKTAYPEDQVDIEWLLDSRLLKPTQDFNMSFESEMAKLILKTAYPEDQGLYTCKASNGYGETSCSARLHVSEEYTLDTTHAMPPKFIHTFHDTDAMEGREVRFDCRIIGIPQPKVAWYLHNREVQDSLEYRIFQANDQHSLVIPKVFLVIPEVSPLTANSLSFQGEVQDSLEYRIFQANDQHSLVIPELTLYLSREVQDSLEYRIFQANDQHSLVIPEVFLVIPELSLYLSREVQDSLEYRIFQANDQHSLVIPEVFPDDEGEVVCKAVNTLGEISCSAELFVDEEEPTITRQSCSAELFVDEEEPTITRQSREGGSTTVAAAVGIIPNFVQRLQNSAVSEGETATFQCRITGDPRPKVMWFHKKREVTAARRVKMSYTEEGVATLVISNASKGDIGVYACVANSPAGKATCVAKLHVETEGVTEEDRDQTPPRSPKPQIKKSRSREIAPKPPYGSPRISSRTATSLILSWNPPPPQQDTESSLSYIIEFRESEDTRWQVKAKNVRETSYLVDRLQEDCIYFFRVSTENDFGVSEPSEESTASNIREGSDSEDEDVLGRPGLVRQGSVKRRGPPGAPEFLALPEDCFTLEGSTAVFSCMLSTRPAVSTVQWLWTGKIIQESRKHQPVFDARTGESSLTVQSVSLRDMGQYQVKAENQHGAMACSVCLGLAESPQFEDIMEDVEMYVGETGRLEVRLYGKPFPDITWLKGTEELPKEKRIIRTRSDEEVVLTINSAVLSDTGVYTCTAKNRAGEVSCKAQVTVSPDIVTIDSTVLSDTGVYTCTAKNRAGEVSYKAQVTVSPVPESTDAEDEETCWTKIHTIREQYRIHEELGKGAFGIIKRVTHRKTGKKFAAKYIRYKPHRKADLQREVTVMAKLEHAGIVRLAETFLDNKFIVMVME
ncbi:MYLK3 [Branchiostoma lanceolatum]|uniref:MYLK3 protein n=1 Tax=Branchiostoma lanceolatum TaxID=7740 RepID=A0A8J9ZA23_BRALA|nr:MYLK3 [Branchiostoma lanceolatum]